MSANSKSRIEIAQVQVVEEAVANLNRSYIKTGFATKQ